MTQEAARYAIWKPEHDGHAPPKLTQELLRKLVRFDGERYFWNSRPRSMFATENGYTAWNATFADTETFNAIAKQSGYCRTGIFGKTYPSHKLIWLFHYGAFPTQQIDHINGIRHDNRLENLRLVTHAENCRNRRIPTTNTSGTIGVTWVAGRRKWRAQIRFNGETHNLGQFKHKADAIAARKQAEKTFGYHPNHGDRTRFEQMKGEAR